jgi:hypothetical protein
VLLIAQVNLRCLEGAGGLVHKVMEMNRNEVAGEWADGTKASDGIQPSASLKIEGEQSTFSGMEAIFEVQAQFMPQV